MKRKELLFLLFAWLPLLLPAQVVWFEPANPPITDSITVFFNAAEGNAALKGHSGDVYLHTGVITSKSLDGHDWKYVVGNWGTDDRRVIMKRKAPDVYTFRMVIKEFYKLREEDKANMLAFVFRDKDGTKVGKTRENEDISVPVDGYVPPVTESSSLNRQKRDLVSLEQKGNSWILQTTDGIVRITPYTNRIVEVVYLKSASEPVDSSHAVSLKPMQVPVNSVVDENGYRLTSGELSILVERKPLKLSFFLGDKRLLAEESGFYQREGNRGVRFALQENERIYGAGSRSVPMDRRNYRLPLYNRPFYGYETGATMLNYSMPLVFSEKNYMLLFDNPVKGYVDIGKTEPDVMEWNSAGGTLRYYVVAAPDFRNLTSEYTTLTGRQEMPPRWALGNLQSRMAYRNQAEADSIVTLMKKKDFPIDALILDFYWFGDSILGHLGRLDWYKPAWPDPDKMISTFKKKGVKTILITEPYIIDSVPNFKIADKLGILATDSLGKSYINHQFYFGPGGLIDIFKPSARAWFWTKYKAQIDRGIAGWWGDLGEPESHPSDIRHVNGTADEVHNIFGHYWDKMLYDQYRLNYPRTRLFHLQRSGFAGTQRFSAYPWTGDVARTWGGLKAQLPQLLTMSMSGLAYMHSDAGGFAQGVKDDDLYTRWLQFAVFTPILRPHGSGIPSEPVYFPEATQDIVRKYMKLRYAMLPYNYTLAWQNSQSGQPLMRPLFYYYPEDKEAVIAEDQYFWGADLLVAPVLEKGAKTRKLYLPEGNWYDFRTGVKTAGKQWLDYPVTIENIPVFVREGAMIPMTKPIATTDLYKADNYTLVYYPSAIPSEFVQYEDDGLNRLAQAENQVEQITWTGRQESGRTFLTIKSEGMWKGKPLKRSISLKIRMQSKPLVIKVNGKLLNAGNYKFDGSFLVVDFTWRNELVKVEIK